MNRSALWAAASLALLFSTTVAVAGPLLSQERVVERLLARQSQTGPLRVTKLDALVPAGATVAPAVSPDGALAWAVVAKNPSWLFMIDSAPGAHFGHPVKLVVVDSVTGQEQERASEWWPSVNGKPVLETLQARTDPKNVVYQRQAPRSRRALRTRFHDEAPVGLGVTWAVIVCGYNDLPDTFDEDTNGMYAVLKSLGLADDHIFYVSPHASHTGVDRPTSVANVQWALGEVAARSTAQDKVAFLYSSHGMVDYLSCLSGGISAKTLAGWLGAIKCKELAVVIEACHSGSLIGTYSDGRYDPAKDDLTGPGATNRVVITSASSDTSSYGDVDGPDDPNPEDIGSESVYGYIMAFGKPSADTDHNGRLSFAEGWKYLVANDVTLIRGDNFPQTHAAGLDPANVYHHFPAVIDAPPDPAPRD